MQATRTNAFGGCATRTCSGINHSQHTSQHLPPRPQSPSPSPSTQSRSSHHSQSFSDLSIDSCVYRSINLPYKAGVPQLDDFHTTQTLTNINDNPPSAPCSPPSHLSSTLHQVECNRHSPSTSLMKSAVISPHHGSSIYSPTSTTTSPLGSQHHSFSFSSPSSSPSDSLRPCSRRASTSSASASTSNSNSTSTSTSTCISTLPVLPCDYWFGNEESDHARFVLQRYMTQFNLSTIKPLHSRAPVQFIGCIKRHKFKAGIVFDSHHQSKKPATHSKQYHVTSPPSLATSRCSSSSSSSSSPSCSSSTTDSSFVTLDEIRIYSRDSLPLGSPMPFLRTVWARTSWDPNDGTPTHIKLIRSSEAKSYKQSSCSALMRKSESTVGNGRSELSDRIESYLYCLPVYSGDSEGEYEYFSSSSMLKGELGYTGTQQQCIYQSFCQLGMRPQGGLMADREGGEDGGGEAKLDDLLQQREKAIAAALQAQCSSSSSSSTDHLVPPQRTNSASIASFTRSDSVSESDLRPSHLSFESETSDEARTPTQFDPLFDSVFTFEDPTTQADDESLIVGAEELDLEEEDEEEEDEDDQNESSQSSVSSASVTRNGVMDEESEMAEQENTDALNIPIHRSNAREVANSLSRSYSDSFSHSKCSDDESSEGSLCASFSQNSAGGTISDRDRLNSLPNTSSRSFEQDLNAMLSSISRAAVPRTISISSRCQHGWAT